MEMWERLLGNLGFSRGSAVWWHFARVFEDSTQPSSNQTGKALRDNSNELAANDIKSIASGVDMWILLK